MFVQPGDDLTLTVSPAAGTDLEDYELTPQCTDATSGDAVPVTGTGPTWTITQPQGTNGSNVVCTITAIAVPSEGTVIATYVDEDGNPIANPTGGIGPVGGDYTTAPKQIPGYTLIAVPANADGQYAEGGTTVTYVYAKVVPATPAGPSVNTGGLALDPAASPWGWAAISAGIALALAAGGMLLFGRRQQVQ